MAIAQRDRPTLYINKKSVRAAGTRMEKIHYADEEFMVINALGLCNLTVLAGLAGVASF